MEIGEYFDVVSFAMVDQVFNYKKQNRFVGYFPDKVIRVGLGSGLGLIITKTVLGSF